MTLQFYIQMRGGVVYRYRGDNVNAKDVNLQKTTEQKIIQLYGVDKYNFFHTPGAHEGLRRYNREGWLVKYLIEDGEKTCVILERTTWD